MAQPKPSLVISGISGRYPMSDDLEEFKRNLFAGVDMVTADNVRWPAGAFRLPTRNGKVYSMDKFDYEFFGVSKDEVEWIDPQERVLMETVYEAILDAGIDPRTLKGSNTGYFRGACYTETNQKFDKPESVPSYHARMVTLIPRFFGLRGPVLDVDAACGSGLLAVAEAYNSVKSGQCDRAIACSSNTIFRPRISMQFRDLKMITKDGKCKCLDSSADGYVRSEAIVALLIQRESESKRVYCRLTACLSNCDGYKEEGITFPSVKGQTQLLRNTYADAGVDPAEVKYIEAHITGTKAGDPAEVGAIYEVICKAKPADEQTLIGCVKSNIGHTESSSGLCAISKAIICYQTGMIPPNIHYKSPNKALPGINDGRLLPVTKATPLPGRYIPLNSFGFGGANIHLITEAFGDLRECDRDITSPLPRLVLMCGRTAEAVKHIQQLLANKPMYSTREFLSLVNDFSKLDVEAMPYRSAMLITGSASTKFNYSPYEINEVREPKPIFLEFDNSIDSLDSIEENLSAFPVIYDTLKDLNEITLPYGIDLALNSSKTGRVNAYAKTVALQIGFVNLLKDLNVEVNGLFGRSVGELVAAYADGLINAEQAVLASIQVGLNENQESKMKEAFSKIIGSGQCRAKKWLTNRSNFPLADYLIHRILTGENGIHPTNDSLVLNISSGGIKLSNSEKASTKSTLESIAAVYIQCGQCPAIENLYPAVNYPLPPSTPFLSPLVRWKHDGFSSLEGYLTKMDGCSGTLAIQTAKNIVTRFEQSKIDDTFLYDHKVDGRILFPATGYLMLAWSTLAKIKGVPLTELAVVFEKVKFIRATVLTEDGETALGVRLNEDSGAFEVIENKNLVVSGYIRQIDQDVSSDSSLSKQLPRLDLEARDVYKELRVRGYDYGPFFQGVESASCDGRVGKVMWRDIVPKHVRDTMTLETDEDIATLWIKSWVPFVDSMFQLQLLRDTSRCLIVPTSIERITCQPEQLSKAIEDGQNTLDQVTGGDASLINVHCDSDLNLIQCAGVTIKGFKGSVIQRKKQAVKVLKSVFVPLFDSQVLDRNEAQIFEDYVQDLIEARKGKPVEANDDASKALLNYLATNNQDTDLSSDMIIGLTRDPRFFTNQRLLKATIDTVVYNLISGNGKSSLDVLEVTSNKFALARTVREILSDHLLYNQYSVNYNLLAKNPSEFNEEVKDDVKDIIEWTSTTMPDGAIPMSHIVIHHYDPTEDNALIMTQLSTAIKQRGFLIVIAPTKSHNESLQELLDHVQHPTAESDQIITECESNGLALISNKRASPSLPFSLLTFRKIDSSQVKPAIQMTIGHSNYSDWFDDLKSELLNGDSNIWLVPRATDGPVNGLLGFAKSLRLEFGGERIRLLVDWTSQTTADINDPKYASIMKNDLVYNMTGDQSEGFGTFEHIACDEDVANDLETKQQSEHVYLRSLKPGDLSSLSWVTNNVPSNRKFMESHVQVYYAPLNFKDILFATGRLPLDAVPMNVSPLTAQDSLLGLEYSGKDQNGNRVMGIVPFKALASSIPITDTERDFMWTVPDTWTLEDAATVPVVYATAIYALLVRGKLTRGETVLIHAGAGGVGLAAISVALAKGAKVFTTVGSEAKRHFLLKQFSELSETDIFNSRDTSFEENVLRTTGGRGVDIVLNSLSDDKLEASLRCLAPNGRFLEIGKVDFIADRALYTNVTLDENRSIHGVFLDTLSKYNDTDYFSEHVKAEKQTLGALMNEGIKAGYVRPLYRTVFERERVEEAFRYMGAGKHVGKVLIKMRDEYKCPTSLNIPALRTTFLNPDKSYVVVGGLGGLGLELVQWLATRGARTIIASSRRGLSSRYQKFVADRLRKQNIRFEISQADVTSPEGARDLVETAIKMASRGLGGVFNSAVVYNDALFVDQTVDMFEQVCAPKAQATIHLDRATRELCPDLDYFVTFSSISSGRGNEGQTNYNFANSTMDAICWLRKAEGLSGLSVQWGVIGDVGLVAELHTKETGATSNEVVLLGAASQRVHSVFETFDRLMCSNSPVMASLVRPSNLGKSGKEGAADLLKIISNVIGLKDISSMDHGISLGQLGIDSLIAVEIKQVIERVIGVNLDLKQVRELTIANVIELSKGGELS